MKGCGADDMDGVGADGVGLKKWAQMAQLESVLLVLGQSGRSGRRWHGGLRQSG
jgi:hypothetical protein